MSNYERGNARVVARVRLGSFPEGDTDTGGCGFSTVTTAMNLIAQCDGAASRPRRRARHQQQQQPTIGLPQNQPPVIILDIDAGQDITQALMSFCEVEPRDMCIMSAVGSVSRVTLRSAATELVRTLEGPFSLLSLDGSMRAVEFGQSARYGVLNVLLAGVDGSVFGGYLAGQLIASSPITVVLGNLGA